MLRLKLKSLILRFLLGAFINLLLSLSADLRQGCKYLITTDNILV